MLMNCAFRRLCIVFESVAIESVDNEVHRCFRRGLTQKMREMPQPGRRYSQRHLFRTL